MTLTRLLGLMTTLALAVAISGCDETGGGKDAGSDSDSDNDSDSDADSDTDTDTDTDTDADTDTDTDTDVDTCGDDVFDGGLTMTGDDAGLDDWEGVIGITGNVAIEFSDLADLQPLACLEFIDGYLSLYGNPDL